MLGCVCVGGGVELIVALLLHCQATIAYEILSFNLHALNAEFGPNFFLQKQGQILKPNIP